MTHAWEAYRTTNPPEENGIPTMVGYFGLAFPLSGCGGLQCTEFAVSAIQLGVGTPCRIVPRQLAEPPVKDLTIMVNDF